MQIRTRLAKLEAAVRPATQPQLPLELQLAIGHLVEQLTEEQLDYFMELLHHSADGNRLGAEHEQQLDAYMKLLFSIASTPGLEPAQPVVKPSAERAAEREKWRRQR